MSRVRLIGVVLFMLASPIAAAGQTADPDPPEPPPLPAFIPPLSDEDRRVAFPDVQGHSVHDDAVHYFVLADQFEWQRSDDASAWAWDTKGWIGRDVDRFWFRTEGEGLGGDLESAEAHLLYGRAVGRWWEFVAGVRQDVRPGPAQTWAAIGVQGLAPYWFEVEATAYVGAGGRTEVRLKTEYELLLTSRVILQPLLEASIHSTADPKRGIGAGLTEIETGARIRYEIRREFAPYIGVSWHRRFFGTAGAARAAHQPAGETRFVAGIRFWR